jgi:beta-glucosidase
VGYNKVNETYCYKHLHLLQDVARDQWKFQGAFCSDWTAVQDAVGAVNAGLNFDLNNRMAYTNDLPGLVENGAVPESRIDELVRPILRTYVLSGLLDGERVGSINTPEHQALALRLAEEGIVLLKNESILPLDARAIRRIAVFGPNADALHCTGGGSGGVRPPYEVTPLQGLKQFCGDRIEVVVQPFQEAAIPIPVEAFHHREEGRSVPGLVARYYNGALEDAIEPDLVRSDAQLAFNWIDNSPAPGTVDPLTFSVSWQGSLTATIEGWYILSVMAKGEYSVTLDGRKVISTRPADHCDPRSAQIRLTPGTSVKLEASFHKNEGDASFTLNWHVPTLTVDAGKLATTADVALVVVGTNHRTEAEGADRTSWELPAGQIDLIRTVAKANPKTIVVIVSGSPLEMASWYDSVPAVLETWYGGMEAGNALANIIFGRVNPSGKLSVTIPRKIENIASDAHCTVKRTGTDKRGRP